MTSSDIVVNIPVSSGNVTAPAAVESSGTTMASMQASLPYQLRESESSAKCGGGILFSGVIFLVGYAAFALMVFITSIIMLADGGWTGVADSCGHNLRDTTLAMTIMLFLLSGGGKQKKYDQATLIGLGIVWIITYGVMGSIMAYENANASNQCNAYLTIATGGVNSPQVVLVNQLVLSWINVVMGLIFVILGFLASD
jgi:hypothetical protein